MAMSASLPQTPPDRPRLTAAALEVGRVQCSLCGAPRLEVCQRQPRAEHLQRWMDAYRAGRIGKQDLADVFAEVVIITRWQVVPEQVA
jgi:hypothetical protein